MKNLICCGIAIAVSVFSISSMQEKHHGKCFEKCHGTMACQEHRKCVDRHHGQCAMTPKKGDCPQCFKHGKECKKCWKECRESLETHGQPTPSK